MAESLSDLQHKYYKISNFGSDGAALGLNQDVTTWNKFGYNNDVDLASPEVIASWGGTFQRMTTADTLSLVSTSAADASGGTGVNSVVIYGIDENREEQIEVLSLNGLTPVVTSNQWLGVNRIAIYLAGSGGVNAGTITATATSAGSTQGQMPAGEGVTQQCILHIPAGTTFLGSYLRCRVNKLSGGGAPRVTLRGWVYSAQNQATQLVFKESLDTGTDTMIQAIFPEPFPVTEKTVLYWTLQTNTNDTVVELRFGGRFVKLS